MWLSNHTLLLDLETNGLQASQDQIISIGAVYEAHGIPEKKIWFIEGLSEEKDALIAFIDWCKNFHTLVSFNGQAFDFPFLLKRLKYHNLDSKDLMTLKWLDPKKTLKRFASKRTQLEALLHFTRQSESSGEDIVHLYRTFTACHVPLYKTLILKHQADELNSLTLLWELYQACYHLKTAQITKVDATTESFKICYTFPEVFHTNFSGDYKNLKLKYTSGLPHFELSGPLFTQPLMHMLTPIKDYYYIETQNQLMHKSLAQFLPTEFKRKATKEECMISELHTFVQLYSSYSCSKKIWFDTESQKYTLWDDTAPQALAHQLFYLLFH